MPDVTQQPLPQADPQQILSQLASLFPQQAAQTGGGGMPPAMSAAPQAPQMPPTGQYAGAGMGPTNAPPPSGGAGGGAGAMQDYANLAAQQQAQLLGSAPAKEAAAARGQAQSYAGQAASTPLPQTAPQIRHGAGFLHNLGQALQRISMVTPEGRYMFGPTGPVYGPGVAQYRATQAGLMGRRQAAESAAEGAEKEVGSVAGVTGRTIYGGAQIQKSEISAAQRAQQVVTQHQDKLAQIAAMKDINQRNNAMKQEITQMRDDTLTAIASDKNATEIDKSNIMSSTAQTLLNTKFAEDPSVMGWIKQEFGVGGMQAPGGAQPVRGNTPPAKRGPGSSKPSAGKIAPNTKVYGPNGQTGYYAGTHPLPQGWSTTPPR
jgi:cell division protein FtsB